MKQRKSRLQNERAAERKPAPSSERLLAQSTQLSALDKEIITHLQNDGRKPFVTIAREMGIPEKTVRSCAHRLITQNAIRIIPLTSPAALGYHSIALVAMMTDPSVALSGIAEELGEIAEVDYVVVTTGRYNIFVEVMTKDNAALCIVVEEKIGRIKGINSVEILPCLSIHYQKARFFPSQGAEDGVGVRERELDQIDRDIVYELSDNARVPLRQVAERLNISETQVRTRIGNMLDAGQLNILAIMNPMNLEGYIIAWVAISANTRASILDLAERLAATSCVSYIAITLGQFDIVAEIVCPSREKFIDLIHGTIRFLPGVERVESFLYLNLIYKNLNPLR